MTFLPLYNYALQPVVQTHMIVIESTAGSGGEVTKCGKVYFCSILKNMFFVDVFR